jgi:hypothetical protein
MFTLKVHWSDCHARDQNNATAWSGRGSVARQPSHPQSGCGSCKPNPESNLGQVQMDKFGGGSLSL